MMYVDPGWYEAHWFGQREKRVHPASAALARTVIGSALIAAMVALLRHFGPHGI